MGRVIGCCAVVAGLAATACALQARRRDGDDDSAQPASPNSPGSGTSSEPAPWEVVDPPQDAPLPAAPEVSADVAAAEASINEHFAAIGVPVPAHEIKLPPAGVEPKGVMLAIHGGAWFIVGPGALRAVDGEVERWRERGFVTVNLDYRAGPNSLQDVTTFYDAIRAWQGPDVVIGATGQSAGGHLSLYIASQRPDLDLVVSEGGPTDLRRLGVDGDPQPHRDLQAAVTNMFGPGRAADAFEGVDLLDHASPARNAASMGARMIVAQGRQDLLINERQAQLMHDARPDLVELVPVDGSTMADGVVPAGHVAWVHQSADAESMARLSAAEDRLADEVLAAHGRS